MHTVTAEWLQSIEALKDVPNDQLEWLINESTIREYAEGEYIFRIGELITGTIIIIRGRVHAFIKQARGIQDIAYFEEKDITGYLPFSRATIAFANGQAVDPSLILRFPVEKMKTLIHTHFELTQALVHVMTTRVREFTAQQQQNEKMMALGKLSAGLSHELNNPAAAIVRGSISLRKHLQLSPETFKEVISIKMDEALVDRVNNRMFEVLAKKQPSLLTMMQRTAKEDELAECLENYKVKNAAEMAENFVEFGFTCGDMEEFVRIIPPQHLSAVLNWINNNLVTEKMVNDIQDASQRIGELVNAVKNFTHMDKERDKEYVDIHSGIRNTLKMLEYKMKKGNIQLKEDFDTSLPPVKAFIGELNQVWTNLIDNALDAMEVNKTGKLEIRTKREREFVQVSVIDDGPGIPPEIKNRIFDPFFTTKEIGKGTGLGLDVVSRIIKQHTGSIQVDSVSGRTAFAVCFPIDG